MRIEITERDLPEVCSCFGGKKRIRAYFREDDKESEEDCPTCGGTGYAPTNLGKLILRLVKEYLPKESTYEG